MTRRVFVKVAMAGVRPESDETLLDDLSRRAFLYFREHTDSHTGLVRDRARTSGEPADGPNHDVASMAATGFGLTAVCIGATRGWMTRSDAERRVLTTLRYLLEAPQVHGFHYHFVGMQDGVRRWRCELSSVDTALLLAGVLTSKEYFGDSREIVRAATALYERVDFRWMLDGHRYLLSHGWYPERGFSSFRWKAYSEHMILYLLGIGSPTHPIPVESWYAWSRPRYRYREFRYVNSVPPLFVHQFSHAWLDFRGRFESRAPNINWFDNSVTATLAHRAFCLSMAKRFPKSYGTDLWGVTASDSESGYIAWGGPPGNRRIDGTVVPCAPGGSLMFTRAVASRALRTMRDRFGDRVYGRYGFCDAFNPTTGWVGPDVIGIDQGITLLSAENARTGSVWRWFMANPDISRAMSAVGLERRADRISATA